MAPKTFLIKFDKADATFVPGENITGCVIIDLEEPKKCRDFRLTFKGKANVKWKQGKKAVKAQERYFKSDQSLIPKSSDAREVEIPVDRNEYRFSFQLPTNIPNSFEHTIGYIRYKAKAIVDIPWRLNWCVKAAFTVVTPSDLNDIAHLCLPIDDENLKTYCCCFFDKGSIYTGINIPSTGYVSGETINIDVFFGVKSNSEVHVTGVAAKLQEIITFYAQRSRLKKKILLHATQYDGPLGRSEQIRLKLSVPSVPPSNLLPCKIIHLQYRIVVNIHVNDFYKKIKKKYPILIGTIPIRFNDEITQPSAPVDPTGNEVTPYPSNLPESIPLVQEGPSQPVGWTMSPPSYEECLQKIKNIEDIDDSHGVFGSDQRFN